MNNPLDAANALRAVMSDLSSQVDSLLGGLTEANRPIRLRLSHEQGVFDDALLVKHVTGIETICGGIEYRLLCVSPRAGLPIKEFIAMPVELQFVTDSGKLRTVCGIVVSVTEGQSDGGLATYLLIVRDALSLMGKRTNTRVFRNKNEVDITQILLDEWRKNNPILARAFNIDLGRLTGIYPAREQTMQYKESDADFLRRLWKRRGLAWFFAPGNASATGSDDTPAHTLVLFDDPGSLTKNAAGTVRYHRNDGTEQRDSITALHATRTLTAGSITRQSWDYKQAGMMLSQESSRIDQGTLGNQFAASLEDYYIDVPHAGDNGDDYRSLGTLRMQRHEYEAQCWHGESAVRDLCIGEWNAVSGHPELDMRPAEEREFVITEIRIEAENNLPKTLHDKTRALFALNQWHAGNDASNRNTGPETSDNACYINRFTCVRRGTPIVPAYDPRIDLPRTEMESVVVVGPAGTDEAHCDEQARIKVRFPGCRPEDHAHAQGAGASGTGSDSAWVRVASSWAGVQHGAPRIPRIGTIGVVSFLGGDPDKPLFTSGVHGGTNPSPVFNHTGNLPGNRYQSGLISKENQGQRTNHLKFEDTTGQISAELASEHGHSIAGLGYLTTARADGQANPRGEGIELCTDESGAFRTAKAMLLTAWKRLNASGKQLSCEEHLALMQDCMDLFKSLGQYAAEHQALPLDEQPQAELKDDITAAPAGSNVDPQGQGGKPTISLTSPAGLAFTTTKTIVSYAGRNIDMVAQQHMQLTSGQRYNVNAGKGISMFAHKDGIKHIAHYGKFIMQSQHDDTEINSAKNVTMTASDGIIRLMGREIHAIAEDGSFIKIGGGITLGTNGAIMQKGASFPFDGPAIMSTEMPTFSGTGVDQAVQSLHIEFTDADGNAPDGEPLAASFHTDGQQRSTSLANGQSTLTDVPLGPFTLRQPLRRS